MKFLKTIGELNQYQPIWILLESNDVYREEKATFFDHRLTLVAFTPNGKTKYFPGHFMGTEDVADTSVKEGNVWKVNFIPTEQGIYGFDICFDMGKDIAAQTTKESAPTAFTGTFTLTIGEPKGDSLFLQHGIPQTTFPTITLSDGTSFRKMGMDSPENLLAYTDFDNTNQKFRGNINWGTQKQPSIAGRLHVEKDGIIAIQPEQENLPDGWEVSKNIPGYSGEGYIQWFGSDYFNEPGNGTISLKLQIEKTGTYRFIWRSTIPPGTPKNDLKNDTWVRFPDADDFYGQEGWGERKIVYPKGSGKTPNPEGSGSDGWFKAYMNEQKWTWMAFTGDKDAHEIWVTFDNPGIYTLEISARSNGHALDKMVLVHNSMENWRGWNTSPNVVEGEVVESDEYIEIIHQHPDGLHNYLNHVRDWKEGDPTWDGGKGKGIIGLLNYLASQGATGYSFLTMNTYLNRQGTGDGQEVHPWSIRTSNTIYDLSKLAQWEIVVKHGYMLGLAPTIKLAETENDSEFTYSPQRMVYHREMVARFSYASSFVISEEVSMNPSQVDSLIEKIKAIDPYGLPVGVHTFKGKPNFEKYYGVLKNDTYKSLQMHFSQALEFADMEMERENIPVVWEETGDWDTGAIVPWEEFKDSVYKAVIRGASGVLLYYGWESGRNYDLTLGDMRAVHNPRRVRILSGLARVLAPYNFKDFTYSNQDGVIAQIGDSTVIAYVIGATAPNYVAETRSTISYYDMEDGSLLDSKEFTGSITPDITISRFFIVEQDKVEEPDPIDPDPIEDPDPIVDPDPTKIDQVLMELETAHALMGLKIDELKELL